jgi:hypothetical protein
MGRAADKHGREGDRSEKRLAHDDLSIWIR